MIPKNRKNDFIRIASALACIKCVYEDIPIVFVPNSGVDDYYYENQWYLREYSDQLAAVDIEKAMGN